MQLTSAATLLVALASGANAFVGTFDAFTDSTCSQGGKGITISTEHDSGTLSADTKSVKLYLENQKCSLGLTFQNAPPQSIPAAQNYVCIQLYKTAAGWNVICT